MQYVFITGGVASSLGKGIASAAVASLLQQRNFKVRIRKLDPYLNVDPGTMSPYQHGEVFVTDDGAETDLDLGHYERFTNRSAKKTDSTSSGKIYSNVLKKERKGDYLGATIQVIPHVTDEIKLFINSNFEDEDIIIYEIGGTVGDIESLPFLEAIRQIRNDKNINSALIHMTYVPYLSSAGELKTKPTQHSVKELRSLGIGPNCLICRSETELPKDEKKKIALFCSVDMSNVISMHDVDTVYSIPLLLHKQKVDEIVLKDLGLKTKKPNLNDWKKVVRAKLNPKKSVEVAMVGKYTELKDSYKSLNEALDHAGIKNNAKVNITFVEAEKLTKRNVKTKLKFADAVLVPGGFGSRGIEGMIIACEYARLKNIPYFGICLGMQIALIEFARNMLGLKGANSTEFDSKTNYPVVALITEWKDKTGKTERRTADSDLGGTMRLGGQTCILKKGSNVFRMYKKNEIVERHRHRYEVNPEFREGFNTKGMNIVGTSVDDMLVEMIEIKNHPWFLGCQFHPEFTSNPRDGHPIFNSFISSTIKTKK